ncbi:uncharacterized protein DAT39_022020 [Clarias magur]|uniref:Uncharacterized protein n=1 Tax=Clarias magur TaxID=1594786 RepID=A0A8J4T385_CLAMG|nr:uncharacterized protein DAT39_022020 [Clarias magur]
MSVVCLPLSAGEDTLELHSVDLEMEALEKQIRDLQSSSLPECLDSVPRELWAEHKDECVLCMCAEEE